MDCVPAAWQMSDTVIDVLSRWLGTREGSGALWDTELDGHKTNNNYFFVFREWKSQACNDINKDQPIGMRGYKKWLPTRNKASRVNSWRVLVPIIFSLMIDEYLECLWGSTKPVVIVTNFCLPVPFFIDIGALIGHKIRISYHFLPLIFVMGWVFIALKITRRKAPQCLKDFDSPISPLNKSVSFFR